MQTFEDFYSNKQFSTELYFKLLNSWLQSKRGWVLVKPHDDYTTQTGNTYGISDKDGNPIGKIDRHFDPETKTLYLEHISTALDPNWERLKGVGLVNLVYEFEKQLPEKYDIEAFAVDPVSSIIKKKLQQFYGKNKFEKVGYRFFIRF